VHSKTLRKFNLFFVLAASLLFVNHTQARDVPLPTQHIIDGTIDEPQSAYPADMDGDGSLDLIGAATAANTIAWWQNVNGDGSTWTRHVIDDTFTGAEEAQAADIDHDGDLDAVGAAQDPASGEIAWWENADGTGTSWNKHSITLMPYAMSVHAADIDRDGDLDVVGANYEDRDIYWWENSAGDGSTWTTHTISIASWGARSISTADVDSDGDLDVLSVAVMADDISWWENNNGDGSSWTEHRLDDFFDAARSIQAADLDRDGDLDILGTALAENRIVWWENSSGDALTWIEHTLTATFVDVRTAYSVDFDQDGDLDVVGAAFNSNRVAWWENSAGDATSWTEHAIDDAFGNAIFAYPVDIDRDGDPDIVGAAELDDTIAWWENETIHSTALYPPEFNHTINSTVDGSVWSEAVDMDVDGDLDVLATGYYDGNVSWFENVNGNATSWTQHIVAQRYMGPYMTQAADFDRDGDPDLVNITITSHGIDWYENVDGRATSWITHTIAYDSFRQIVVADLDIDGDDDMIATSYNSDTPLRWWENQNDGSVWSEHVIAPYQLNGMRAVNIADFDNDGDLDVVAGTEALSYVNWYENIDGIGGSWSQHSVDSNFARPSYLDIVDLDRDGDIDILGTAYSENEVVWWENTTQGTTWNRHVIDVAFANADTTRAFDVDLDGDLDVLGASLSADLTDEYTWWENNGDATTWTKHFLAYGDNATCINAADLDQDGDMDILGAAYNADHVVWWENRGGQFGLATTATAPATLNAGSQDDILQIVATHNGRSPDHDAELVTFELLLEETAGDPLSDSEANAIIENLHVYQDDGSGVFEAGSDTWVTAVSNLTLTNGLQTVTFADGDPNVQLAWGMPRTYFVVVELAANLADDPNRNSINTIRLTHITEASSTGEDRDFDIPLTLAFAANVAADLVLYSPTAVILLDTAVHNSTAPFYIILTGLAGLLILSGAVWRRRKRGN
jgi:hypothetical protein